MAYGWRSPRIGSRIARAINAAADAKTARPYHRSTRPTGKHDLPFDVTGQTKRRPARPRAHDEGGEQHSLVEAVAFGRCGSVRAASVHRALQASDPVAGLPAVVRDRSDEQLRPAGGGQERGGEAREAGAPPPPT